MLSETRGAQILALAATTALLATGCAAGAGGGEGEKPADGKTTITWWHNSNNGDGKAYYGKVAADFEAAHEGVDVEVNAMQHEDMLTKLDAAFQSGDAPDVYMERGGGELAAHVAAGLTKDLTEAASEEIAFLGENAGGWQLEGKTYALPFSLGGAGFWYNKALFKEAGIDKAPQTFSELIDATEKLKKAGIDPISVGAGDKWPAAHYWYYAAVRECSQQTMADSIANLDFSDQCFTKAGEDVDKLIKAEPFNPGFLSTPAQSGPTSASGLLATGKVAMELAGHWEPGVMQGLTEDGKGMGDDTGWFPFPEIEGGQGDPAAQLGGGDAWAVSEGAPDAAVDFVKYMLSDEVQRGFAELDMGLPTNPAAKGAISDPALASLMDVRDKAPYFQLYFDTAFGASIGGAMNDEIALLFAGQSDAQKIVDASQDAADLEK
ncbi:extracellular solute-binding protein [Glutamicibacter arilaitensis]|uniref:ABC transporter substrate-binding protein n=2 Tax=Glutamicibacter arilaitensis TaxID=256701 RepID=A0A2N7S0E3_9MICC|nr:MULTISPECIES: extracellular solute-binding protein [Glutamicibacter]PMQ19612.1 ABC transporter substrate-binding protein [Glutamicibacter arilaitensis]CBT74434.1 putative xylobiose ABC transporter, substrate-binding protein BxlE [Glutamicibacter arilaitensis Re117]HCH47923.1 ABC transporter substrate-binding protein [Glutamicibacter sp.]HCJ53421.1 ABC transporter substrate-binding protein [Glutamicibacter sp.]